MRDLFTPPATLKFYVGLHLPWHAQYFSRSMVSINRLRYRKGPFAVHDWIMDSGAFTEISNHGHYRHTVAEYAAEARRWTALGNLELIVAQDYMCEAFILKKWNKTVPEHQRLTVDRYDRLIDYDLNGVPVMPVLQGFTPDEYARCADLYAERLRPGQRVGVGSICKRNGNPAAIIAVLSRIQLERPDILLHGFGLKTIALAVPEICQLLHSADSMAWSLAAFHERYGSQNDWREAKRFEQKILAGFEYVI